MIAEVVETRVGPIDFDTALRASRFAALWIDEFKAITEGGEDAEDGPQVVIKRARHRALEKADGIDRYPSGVPTLKTIMASWYAFTLSFVPEEQPQVWEILTSTEES